MVVVHTDDSLSLYWTAMASKTAPLKVHFATTESFIWPPLQFKQPITNYTLEILPKKNPEINPAIVLHRIFDAIKKIDENEVIISFDQIKPTHSKEIPEDAEYKNVFIELLTVYTYPSS